MAGRRGEGRSGEWRRRRDVNVNELKDRDTQRVAFPSVSNRPNDSHRIEMAILRCFSHHGVGVDEFVVQPNLQKRLVGCGHDVDTQRSAANGWRENRLGRR